MRSLNKDYGNKRPLFHQKNHQNRYYQPIDTKSKGRSAKSQLFSVLGPQWWKELPAALRTAESLTIFRKGLKTHLFRVHLDSA